MKSLPVKGRLQRVEKVSTRWQRLKKVGRFFVLTFVAVLSTAECKNGKSKETQGFLDESLEFSKIICF